ncbi:MAG TPA: hypothetical protein VJ570_14150 [Holophagaceae bacterium]|nr:hypothetical protein [Holophagaceae bacterium]
MRKLLRSMVLGATALLATACAPALLKGPLVRPEAGQGRLVVARAEAVQVRVQDARPAGSVLAGGLLGGKEGTTDGVYRAYGTESPGALTDYMAGSAQEALATLGLKAGAGIPLTVSLKGLRVDLSRYSAMSPMNCAGLCHLETTLQLPGAEPRTRSFKLAFYETTVPVWTMGEVAGGALSRILHQATCEAVVRTLQEALPGSPDGEALARLLGTARGADEKKGRQSVFWLGLTGGGNAEVKAALVALYRDSKLQHVREGAVEAVGMLGLREEAPFVEGLLAKGGGKESDWDLGDAEQVWYLLKALHLLGVAPLEARIPTGDMKDRSKLSVLVKFLESGEIPPLSAEEQKMLDQARGSN